MEEYTIRNKSKFSGGRVAALIVAGFFLLIALVSSIVNIGPGEAGVVFRPFGGGVDTVHPPLSEGVHLIAPWNKVYVYNIRQQQLFESMKVLSQDGLDIKLDASIWFQPVVKDLAKLHKYRGRHYVDDVLKPAVRSATRAVVGRYTPEQIYSSKREAIQQEIYDETKKLLDKQFVQLNKILVRDVTLPPTIKTAIERKLKQQQEALEYEFKLQKEQKEAERKRIEAKGIRDFQHIVTEGISDKLLRWKGIEATLKLAESNNSKVIVIGSGKDGLPIILNPEK
ncbi:MAG: prohibitin family protein [Chlorobi bacterium]|nr:prohibitin family protein [Chlorobiota bacterium]